MKEFKSKHKLELKTVPNPYGDPNGLRFQIGTVEGVFETNSQIYHILDVRNHHPGNGHHRDFLEWFDFLCIRDNKDLIFNIVLKEYYRKHLMEKQGFSILKGYNLIKHYVKQYLKNDELMFTHGSITYRYYREAGKANPTKEDCNEWLEGLPGFDGQRFYLPHKKG